MCVFVKTYRVGVESRPEKQTERDRESRAVHQREGATKCKKRNVLGCGRLTAIID